MSTDLLAPMPAPPTDMVAWSRSAATFLKLAARGATLTGELETFSKGYTKLTESTGALRAELERKIEKLTGDESAESRKQADELRTELERYNKAVNEDLLAARRQIETRVREALACEKAFTETSCMLLEHLRAKPTCRELLEGIV